MLFFDEDTVLRFDHTRYSQLTAMFLATLCCACTGNKNTTTEAPPVAPTSGEESEQTSPLAAAETTPPAPEPEPEPALELAKAPRIDLLDNRYRWHHYRDGLVIPFGHEGFRKYTQEYRRPFGEVVWHEDARGRILTRSAAEMRIPWEHEGNATARLWVSGLSKGQRVGLHINGKRAKTLSVDAKEWSQLVYPIDAGMLRPGENTISLHIAKRGKVGGKNSYALLRALEILPGEHEAASAPPADAFVEEVTGSEDVSLALTGFPRQVMYVEVPQDGWLRVDLGNPTDKEQPFAVSARTFDGKPVTLLDGKMDANAWGRHDIDLGKLSRRVIALELRSSPQLLWGDPYIGVAQAEPARQPEPLDNAILVVVDALRADRLKLYGETRVETPKMTAAGAQGFVFMHNQASAPSSPPSHGSIQSGMIPRVHGIAGDKGSLKPGTPLISAQLADAGFATGYYGNNPFGMRRLKDGGKWTEYHSPNSEGLGIDCEAVVSETLKFAKAQLEKEKRFFVSALPFEPHTPYRYHEGISEKYHDGSWGPPVGKSVDGYLLGDITGGKKLSEAQWSQLRALYDGEVEHMDGCFGQLMAGLEELGVRDKTAVIITADHGEGMFEHGRMGHAFGHYAELSNVPFVVYAPGWIEDGPRQLEVVTANIDIAPTILGLLGITPDEKMQGRDMSDVPLRNGPWTPRVVSLEYGRSYALRSLRWKFMVTYSGEESLYDLEVDPTEQNDIIESNPFALRYMRDLTGFFLEHRSEWRAHSWKNFGDHGKGFVEHIQKLEQANLPKPTESDPQSGEEK